MQTANAASVTLPVGVSAIVSDPEGSGRNALLVFNGATSTLSFSVGSFDRLEVGTLGGAVGAFNALNLVIKPTGSATVTESTIPDVLYDEPVRVSSRVINPLSSVTLDQNSGDIRGFATSGGFTLSGDRSARAVDGGSVSVSNVRFDLANMQVLADLDGVSVRAGLQAEQTFSERNAVLWTFASFSGPDALPPSALLSADPAQALQLEGCSVERRIVGQIVGYTGGGGYVGCNVADGGGYGGRYGASYGYGGGSSACYYSPPQPICDSSFGHVLTGQARLSGLQMSTLAFDFFKKALGLKDVGVAVLNSVIDHGSVTLQTSYVVNIPEPSTYALMGLEQLCIAGVQVRRRA